MHSEKFGQPSLFAELQTLSGVGSFEWNLETNELHWSDQLFHIYGIEPTLESIRVEDFLERVHPDDREATTEAVQLALYQTGRLQREERIVRPDGSVRLLESRGLVIRDNSGKATRFIGSCRDITSLRKTENALKWQLDGQAILSDVAKDLLAATTKPERWRRLLKRLAAHADCDAFASFRVDGDKTTLQTHGGFAADFVPANAHGVVGHEPFGICAATGQTLYLTEDQLRDSPNMQGLVEQGIRAFVCGPLMDSTSVLGTLAFASTRRDGFDQQELDFMNAACDVIAVAKARHRADLGLTASEARCQLVVDHAKMVIWESDRCIDQFSYVTGSCEAFLGFGESQWREPGFWKRQIHDKDRESVVNACMQAVEECEDFRHEYRMLRSNGDAIWVEHIFKVIVNDEAIVGLRGALLDVTARKLLEDQCLQAQKMEAVGTLTGGIAHDFNNLLAAIIANLENAKYIATKPPWNVHAIAVLEPVNAAFYAAERAAATVRQLLAFSRRGSSDQQPTDCNQVLQSAIKLVSPVLDASFRLQLDLCDSQPIVMGNAAQLEHVILNLCNNCRDAMPAGGEIVVASNVRKGTKDCVVISVSDSGCGMTAETQARMFEPFFSSKDVGRGSGLGLAMCYAIVEQHQGAIHCDSHLGHGTQFEIVLPALDRSRDERSSACTVPNEKRFLQPLSVLLVDDEDAVRQAVAGLLESLGCQTLQARSGDDALQLLNSSPPPLVDAVLLDRTMPGLDGWETLQEMSRVRPSMPVILCSGYLRCKEKNPGDAAPAAVLQKPYTVTQLTTVLQEVIRKPTH